MIVFYSLEEMKMKIDERLMKIAERLMVWDYKLFTIFVLSFNKWNKV